MRSFRVVFPLTLVLAAAIGTAQEEHLTDARQDGFLGPVKSGPTKVSNSRVSWQQPAGPSLVTPIWCRDCEYDPDGTKTVSGQISDGKVVGDNIALDRDPDG